MTEDAEKYKQEDDELRERLEMRNSLENMIYTTKNSYNDKIKEEDNTEKEQYTKNVDMLNTFSEWLENNQDASKEDLKMKIDQVQFLAKDLYSKTPSEPPVSDDLD